MIAFLNKCFFPVLSSLCLFFSIYFWGGALICGYSAETLGALAHMVRGDIEIDDQYHTAFKSDMKILSDSFDGLITRLKNGKVFYWKSLYTSWFDMSVIAMWQGNVVAALAYIDQALIYNPNYSPLYMLRGDLLKFTGDFKKSANCYEVAECLVSANCSDIRFNACF